MCARDARADQGASCHPAIDAEKAQYLLGYGSLLDKLSEDSTWPSAGPNLPAYLFGFERRWNVRGRVGRDGITYLGAVPDSDAELVGGLYRVGDIADFASGDKRETGYCRVPVDPATIRMIDGDGPPRSGQIWIYQAEPRSRHAPDARFPIYQSYADLFLSGCIELSARVEGLDLLKACIATTAGWSIHWIDDRRHPLRPAHQAVDIERIDAALRDLVPGPFRARRKER